MLVVVAVGGASRFACLLLCDGSNISNAHKWKRLRLVSISDLCTHSYSPNFESKVPFCKVCSFKVKRGPNSCSRAMTAS